MKPISQNISQATHHERVRLHLFTTLHALGGDPHPPANVAEAVRATIAGAVDVLGKEQVDVLVATLPDHIRAPVLSHARGGKK